MQKRIRLIACIILIGSLVNAQKLLLRYPAISPDGATVAFSYQGDIWTVTSGGGNATRLTIHEAYESNPVFSPDGKQIAFSGARYGNNDIFVMPTEGGQAKRLTWHSSADNIASWTMPGEILFSTSREFKRQERPFEVYEVSPKGGTEKRIMDAVGYDPVQSPDGRFIAFVRGDINPVYRQEYRGASNRDIWLFDTKNKTYIKLPGFDTNDILPQWGDNNTLYFLSSNEGTYNLYRLKIDGNGKASAGPEKLTDFKDEAIRHYAISKDGGSIVYEKEMGLYLLKPGQGNGQQLNIVINADDRFDAEEQKTFTSGLNNYALSPNGKLMAFEIRGEVFVKEADKEKTRAVNISNHSFRDMETAWLNDSTLVFSSDREKDNFDLYMVKSVDTAEINIFKSLKHGLEKLTNTAENENNLVVSPDGKKIAFKRGTDKLVVADISPAGKLSNEKILVQSWEAPEEIAWSPDSKWLAYSQNDLNYNRDLYRQPITR